MTCLRLVLVSSALTVQPISSSFLVVARRHYRYTLPPPGVFNWHYLQCVVLRFGTPQYKAFFNIYFSVHSFRTASDDTDDESVGSFDDANPPYPSYHFDRFLQRQSDHNQTLERHKEVLQWTSDIPSGNADEGT